MNVQQTGKQKGFTIIEVVLVLAIAGLIFLMVFIALPALQRNQRDTQRRNDASTFLSQLQSYTTNNRGGVPDSEADLITFKTNYLKWQAGAGGDFNDPTTGLGYVISYTVSDPSVDGSISYMNGAVCAGESMTTNGATARSAAVAIKLEGSGIFCSDNQ